MITATTHGERVESQTAMTAAVETAVNLSPPSAQAAVFFSRRTSAGSTSVASAVTSHTTTVAAIQAPDAADAQPVGEQ